MNKPNNEQGRWGYFYETDGNVRLLSISKTDALEMAKGMYVGDPCPCCDQPMARVDLNTAITSDVSARPSHLACWNKHAESC